jgi:hypothetical protein
VKRDLGGGIWHTSSRSGGENCVEVATNLPGVVAVRDTKDGGAGPALVFTDAEWIAFVGGVRDGEFDK